MPYLDCTGISPWLGRKPGAPVPPRLQEGGKPHVELEEEEEVVEEVEEE